MLRVTDRVVPVTRALFWLLLVVFVQVCYFLIDYNCPKHQHVVDHVISLTETHTQYSHTTVPKIYTSQYGLRIQNSKEPRNVHTHVPKRYTSQYGPSIFTRFLTLFIKTIITLYMYKRIQKRRGVRNVHTQVSTRSTTAQMDSVLTCVLCWSYYEKDITFIK